MINFTPRFTLGEGIFEAGFVRDGAEVLEERKFSCPCQHLTARLLLYPSYSTFVCRTDRLNASYSPCSASSRSCNVCPASATSHFLLHALLTCKLTTTPTDPYNDREVSCTYYWSIHRQFSPSASPFMSYRLHSVISVRSQSVFSVFLRKPSV